MAVRLMPWITLNHSVELNRLMNIANAETLVQIEWNGMETRTVDNIQKVFVEENSSKCTAPEGTEDEDNGSFVFLKEEISLNSGCE